MLKLLIVDDEEIICNTIATTIDWKSVDIELMGTCQDGVEAYHMILDELPDIVMTDIRMPGISGLELVERIMKTDLNVHFIILSGYGEFEYAKRVMKCGIRHYLLKPCDDQQILESVKEVAKECRKELSHGAAAQNIMLDNLQHTLVHNIIREGFTLPKVTPSLFSSYEQYINLYDIPYQLCYIYYLEKKNLPFCLDTISTYLNKQAPELKIYKIYVSNILLLFFPNFMSDYEPMDNFLKNLSFQEQTVSIAYERISFPDFHALLVHLIQKLKRYDLLYFFDDKRMIPNFNYGHIVVQCSQLIEKIINEDTPGKEKALNEIRLILESSTNTDFLFQLADDILIKLSTQMQDIAMEKVIDFLVVLHQKTDNREICQIVMQKIQDILQRRVSLPTHFSPVVEKVIAYLDEHLSDPDLTLKWIAENHLYMNVNYVSRCFVKETQQKFTGYLMNLRIERAKVIFKSNDKEKIQNVAELVGCGDNPYYFNKIFKKCTGMSPSMYLRKLQAKEIFTE